MKIKVVRRGLTAVQGIRVGHFTFPSQPRGCTVILCTRHSTVASVESRGGAPATRETDALQPDRSITTVHAIVLTGGSVYGLASAVGVTRWLQERGRGIRIGPRPTDVVPIVPAAAIFDLGVGPFSLAPTAKSGYMAAEAASAAPVLQGNVGAGAGATVGKLAGLARSMRGGLGSVALSMRCNCLRHKKKHAVVVGALMVVNPLGDVVHESGRILAGVRAGAKSCNMVGAWKVMTATTEATAGLHNSVIGVVATNVKLTKVQCKIVAQMAHDGYARAIQPAHTPVDGDTLFSLSTGAVECSTNEFVIGTLAAEAVRRSIVSAIQRASSLTQRRPSLWIPSWHRCRGANQKKKKKAERPTNQIFMRIKDTIE